MAVKFEIKGVLNTNIGSMNDSVVKVEDGKPDDVWCSIADLDLLFTACERKWGNNWDLNKICVAIAEADFQ